ncbi:RES family NAD+ phosphorylase [Bradyrhizobium aeschynomenes]|uniref:RES family NAD+ phosphorylase n=1 Tax=Bradyrhizobium aeschynomenes TaxID=2734909 RepID=UPI001551D729|nr:RES family NAD+ phosphorylase [Bradyrhizobium aeschynomenes]NPV22111.1 RES family NAD+ phosphorylase [Bradyrhizobium aeschynomenes]
MSESRASIRAHTHRLIASRYPTVGIFDDLNLSQEELTVAFLLESVTNDRLTSYSGRLQLLRPSEIVQGPTANMVMAAFLHADETGGRFTDGRLGAWYAALELETAIAETVHHNTRRLRLSEGAFPSNIQMRQLIAGIDCSLIDIRGQQETRPELYAANEYSKSRAFGLALRWPSSGEGENGIVFASVRRKGGTNVCVFRPSLILLPVMQGDHYQYSWDNKGDVTVSKLVNIDHR